VSIFPVEITYPTRRFIMEFRHIVPAKKQRMLKEKDKFEIILCKL